MILVMKFNHSICLVEETVLVGIHLAKYSLSGNFLGTRNPGVDDDCFFRAIFYSLGNASQTGDLSGLEDPPLP